MSLNKRARTYRTPASDLFESGWLPSYRAAQALGCTERELHDRYRHGTIRRKSIGPGAWLYEVPTVRA